jgi:predicted MPP superfamily phosphohydrolase
MFNTIVTLVYVIPNLYVFIRIGQLFISRRHRLRYTFIFLSIALFFPIVNILPRNETGFFFLFLYKTAGYLLPYCLYLFQFLLLFDIFLLVNRFTGMVSRDNLLNNRFRTIALSSILVASMLVVVAGAINFNTIRTSEYEVEIPRKYSSLEQLKVVFVSDFHLKENTDFGFVERYVQRVREIGPDLLLYGGDIVEGRREGGQMARYEDILRGIHPRYGVYAVLGNHEYYTGNNDGNFFSRAGMKLLGDSVVVVDHLFNLGGRYDSRFGRRSSIGDLMKQVNDSLPMILLDHKPSEIEQVSNTKVDVQFSGHTHNGQMFPVNLILRSMNRLTWGYEKIRDTHFFVSSGIRMWGPPVRTVGKSEIMVVTVRFR